MPRFGPCNLSVGSTIASVWRQMITDFMPRSIGHSAGWPVSLFRYLGQKWIGWTKGHLEDSLKPEKRESPENRLSCPTGFTRPLSVIISEIQPRPEEFAQNSASIAAKPSDLHEGAANLMNASCTPLIFDQHERIPLAPLSRYGLYQLTP